MIALLIVCVFAGYVVGRSEGAKRRNFVNHSQKVSR